MTDTPDRTPEQDALQRVFDEGLVTLHAINGELPKYRWMPQGIRLFKQLLDADPRVPAIVSTNAPGDSADIAIGDVVRFRGPDGLYHWALVEDPDAPYEDGFRMLLVKDRYGRKSTVRHSKAVRTDPPIGPSK